MYDIIETLIQEGHAHSFEKNSYRSEYGTFGRPSIEMVAWYTECEDFISKNYGKESAAWKTFSRFNPNQLSGNGKHTFELEKEKLIAALASCLRIKPDNHNSKVVTSELDLTKVFIVHGHDESLKNEVARFIQQLSLTPIILHEQASSGKTIIEKIEEHSNAGFGIVLYTPCDKGGENKGNAKVNFRARQNVVFEHGYLIGKIGRKNVCALVKGEIEKPNDISGIVYIPTLGEWKLDVAKELRKSGFDIDMNLIV